MARQRSKALSVLGKGSTSPPVFASCQGPGRSPIGVRPASDRHHSGLSSGRSVANNEISASLAGMTRTLLVSRLATLSQCALACCAFTFCGLVSPAHAADSVSVLPPFQRSLSIGIGVGIRSKRSGILEDGGASAGGQQARVSYLHQFAFPFGVKTSASVFAGGWEVVPLRKGNYYGGQVQAMPFARASKSLIAGPVFGLGRQRFTYRQQDRPPGQSDFSESFAVLGAATAWLFGPNDQAQVTFELTRIIGDQALTEGSLSVSLGLL